MDMAFFPCSEMLSLQELYIWDCVSWQPKAIGKIYIRIYTHMSEIAIGSKTQSVRYLNTSTLSQPLAEFLPLLLSKLKSSPLFQGSAQTLLVWTVLSEGTLSHQPGRVVLLLVSRVQSPGHNPQLRALIVCFHLGALLGQDVPARGRGWGRGLVRGGLVGGRRVARENDGLASVQAVVHGVAEVGGARRVVERSCSPFHGHLQIRAAKSECINHLSQDDSQINQAQSFKNR